MKIEKIDIRKYNKKFDLSEFTKEYYEPAKKNIRLKTDNLILYESYREHWQNYKILFAEAQDERIKSIKAISK